MLPCAPACCAHCCALLLLLAHLLARVIVHCCHHAGEAACTQGLEQCVARADLHPQSCVHKKCVQEDKLGVCWQRTTLRGNHQLLGIAHLAAAGVRSNRTGWCAEQAALSHLRSGPACAATAPATAAHPRSSSPCRTYPVPRSPLQLAWLVSCGAARKRGVKGLLLSGSKSPCTGLLPFSEAVETAKVILSGRQCSLGRVLHGIWSLWRGWPRWQCCPGLQALQGGAAPRGVHISNAALSRLSC